MVPSQTLVLTYPFCNMRRRTSRKSFNHKRLSKVSDQIEFKANEDFVHISSKRSFHTFILTINGKIDSKFIGWTSPSSSEGAAD